MAIRLCASAVAASSLLVAPDLLRFMAAGGGQVRYVGFAWLLHTILPDSWMVRVLSPWAETLYRYHPLAKLSDWMGLLGDAVLVNVILGAIICVVAAPVLSLLEKTRQADKTPRWPALGPWLICLCPLLLHLLTGFAPAPVPVLAAASLVAILAVFRIAQNMALPVRALRAMTAAGIVLFVAAAASQALPDTSPPPAPNVLLVSIDTLRPDHLHCYGYPTETSPTIDRLAAEGALFSQAISPASWTLPAHITLFSAIPPAHHRVTMDGRKLGENAKMLTEVLSDNGYQTAAVVSGVYLEPSYGFGQGFESYDFSPALGDKPETGVTSPKVESSAREWLKKWKEGADGRPFFLFLHFFDTHFDFVPPSPFDRMFDPDYEGPVDGRRFIPSDLYSPDMDPRDLRHLMSLYDGEIRFTDHHLGRIIDYLRTIGELDRTIVVVTSDHGEEFFEHGRKGHRMTLFDEVTRVPLIVRYPPRVPAGRVIDQQVRLMDVPATILSLAGVNLPADFGMQRTGLSFRPQNLTRWIERRPALPAIPSHGELHDDLHFLRTEQKKLIYQVPQDYPSFYDLVEDPNEQNDLALEREQEVDAMKREIKSFLRGGESPALAQPGEVDERQVERLRSLGYVN